MECGIYLCVCQVSGAGLNLQSVVSVVQQTVERLSRTKQEVNELQSQQQEYCRKYRERLLKVRTTLCQSLEKKKVSSVQYKKSCTAK